MPVPEYVRRLRDHVGHDPLFLPGSTAVVLRDIGDRVQVLCQRRADNGLWGLPGGLVEPGEQPHDVAERETLEETGITARVVSLVRLETSEPFTYPNGDQVTFLDMVFRLEPTGGEISVDGDESLEVAWFDVDDAPLEIEKMRGFLIDAVEDLQAARARPTSLGRRKDNRNRQKQPK